MPLEPESPVNPSQQSGVSGKYVVLAMLGFGAALTAFLWIYTYLNNKPFIPLRHALFQKFTRQTSPRVEGGRERGRGPNKLRIVLQVEFDPSADTAENRQRRLKMEADAMDLARQHLDLAPYENWEFILIRYVAEGVPQRWESKRTMAEVLELAKK